MGETWHSKGYSGDCANAVPVECDFQHPTDRIEVEGNIAPIVKSPTRKLEYNTTEQSARLEEFEGGHDTIGGSRTQ